MNELDQNLLRGVLALVAFVCFLAIAAWAYWPRNRTRFDEAARLPLDD
jgi:cbb3-type cytochrome oxidase subunit 3